MRYSGSPIFSSRNSWTFTALPEGLTLLRRRLDRVTAPVRCLKLLTGRDRGKSQFPPFTAGPETTSDPEVGLTWRRSMRSPDLPRKLPTMWWVRSLAHMRWWRLKVGNEFMVGLASWVMICGEPVGPNPEKVWKTGVSDCNWIFPTSRPRSPSSLGLGRAPRTDQDFGNCRPSVFSESGPTVHR